MEAREFRVGLYVHQIGMKTQERNRYGIEESWNISDSDVIVDYGIMGFALKNPEWYEGIPLTEEWLLRLGATLIKKADYVNVDFSVYEFADDLFYIDDRFNVFHDKFDSEIYLGYELKYVHQLQNLFYSLTGEELTIKTEVSNG